MLSIFFIGLALSMDAFSVALTIGLSLTSKIKKMFIPIIVGLMHFIMPLIGLSFGTKIISIININPKIILITMLLYLVIDMFKEHKKNEPPKITSYLSIFLFAFSVSLDSFSIGIGLPGLTNHYILSSIVFMFCSGCITYMGLILGKYSSNILKQKSYLLGIIIISILIIVNICQLIFN